MNFYLKCSYKACLHFSGGWWAYDSRTAEYIEEHFQIYQQQQQKHAQAQIEEVENKDDNKARYQQQLQQQEEQQPPPPPQPNQTYLNNTDSFNVNHTCDVLVCGSIYIIDFLKMIQYPENNKRKVRKIHRSKDIHAKGIAGIHNHTFRNHRTSKPY